MSSNKRHLLIGIIVGSLVVIACSVAVVAFVPVEEGADNGEPTARATSTPLPTATTEQCPTATEQRYWVALDEQSTLIGEGLVTIGGLLGQVENDALLLFDDAWAAAVAIQIAVMDVAADAMIKLDAPRSLSHVRVQIEESANYTKAGNDEMAWGLDNIDVEAIENAVALYTTGANTAEEAGDLLRNLCN